MHEQSAAQFGFEPGRFWGHDLILIGQFDQLADGRRMECKRHGEFAGIDQFDKLIITAYAADKVDSLVGTRVVDAEQRRQEIVLQNGDIQASDGIVLIDECR